MSNAEKTTVKLAKFTLKNVPAYKKFLIDQKAANKSIANFANFSALPVANAKNYIAKYPLFQLYPRGRMPSLIHSSSGSSGQPTFWFRDLNQEKNGGVLHKKIFSEIFHIQKREPTLVIICFSMGVWVAGGYTLASCRWLSEQGYNLACITPGIERHDILNILKNLAPKFQNIIIAGYPAFLIDILKEAKDKNLIPKNLKLLTAGDAFSEPWRQTALKLINQKQSEAIVSVYGSADAGAIAFETPLGIFIKKAALKNKVLFARLFNYAVKEPSVFQYLPEQMFIESIDNELVLTAHNTVPLIRYNIHDQGKVFSWKEMTKMLKEHNLLSSAKKHGLNEWQLPFVVQYGRTDVAVTFYALNIYPENIQASLKDRHIAKMVSGNFRAFTCPVNNFKREDLHLEIEVAEGIKPTKKMSDKITNTIFGKLLKLNSEFRKLHEIIGQVAKPKIRLVKQLQPLPISQSSLVCIKGKKPKIFI